MGFAALIQDINTFYLIDDKKILCYLSNRNITRRKYLFREFSKLKTQANRFIVKDFNVFSPANERNSFTAMYQAIKNDNDVLIDNYLSIDHSTGNTLALDYSTIED